MSSNNPLVPTTEETIKKVIGNLKTDKQQASQIKNKKAISNEPDKDMAFNKSGSLDKSTSSSRTETEETLQPENKKISISLASLDDKDTKRATTKMNKD